MSYSYSLSFQEHILASFLGDKKFLKSHQEVFVPEYFSDEVLRGIAESGIEFFKEQKDIPSKEALLYEIKKVISPGRKFHEYSESIEKIYEKIGDNSNYYQSKAIEFAKSQGLANALREAPILLESGEVYEIEKLISRASKIGEGFGKNVIYDYFRRAKQRAKEYRQTTSIQKDSIATGFYPLDETMEDKGLGKGELGVIIGLPKHGKTTSMVNFAVNSMLQNKKVAYFTLELSKKKIASKFDARFFGRSIDHIKKKPKAFYSAIQELRKKLEGNLRILDYPTKSLTVEGFHSAIERMEDVDIAFADYGQVFKPSMGRGERRHEISDVYEGLRRVAGEAKIPIWTAHQSNRPGTNTKIIGMEHIAEDFNVVAIADIVISLNQTEEEKRRGKLRFYVIGSRIGESGRQIDCNVDWKISSITTATDEEEALN